MGDYKLEGLNPRDFQHLIQAIARKVVSPAVTALGDGKDGGRDLIFRGRTDYPSMSEPWDGYLIVGCKFSITVLEDPAKAYKWAKGQLDRDLDKFRDRRRKLLKPDYYLFVTNLRLTPVHDVGSRDRLTKQLFNAAKSLGLKGCGIWDYHDIRGFLDAHHDIRRAYGHFVTAGDVLQQVATSLQLQRPDFLDVAHTFLQKELISDMSAKLQAAGEDPDVQIPLANVFIDLPFESTAEAMLTEETEGRKRQQLIVKRLLEMGSLVSRQTKERDDTRQAMTSGTEKKTHARLVVVGGPGQGKSTISQYACQLYRAALLSDRPPEHLDEKARRALTVLRTQSKEVGGLPVARRFPARVELRTFSSALQSKPSLSLFEYIRLDIARLSNSDISRADLKNWLKEQPWFIVFDGLDEVPPSSNRAEVLREIDAFFVDAATANADLFALITTRPQSYTNSFASFEHAFLAPLSPKQALEYGKRLVEARTDDVRRRDEVVRSLTKACKNEATARLMQTPLQITIMATLLEDTGEPPQQRYRLFAEYYQTIYRRETRRRLLGGILSERRTDIDTIHAHAGLSLHAASELATHTPTSASGDAEAALSDAQFRKLVANRLHSIGVGGERASNILDHISDGSLQRLVFLVRPRDGWIRFDIASLKEFMSAEALTTDSDDLVRERLGAVASASYWRNVFLFAVGKCFAHREHLLPHVVSLCVSLNEAKSASGLIGADAAGPAASSTLWGSRLALDVLSDGTSRQNPQVECQFARMALQLLRFPDDAVNLGLAAAYHEELRDLYEQEITNRLNQTHFEHQLGGWQVLMALAHRDTRWAIELVDKRWPSALDHRLRLLGRYIGSGSKHWYTRKLVDALADAGPTFFLRYPIRSDSKQKVLPEPWDRIVRIFQGAGRRLEIANRSSFSSLANRYFITPAGLGSEFADLRALKDPHKDWAPYIAAARFGERPSAVALSRELRGLCSKWKPDVQIWRSVMPWPFAACLQAATNAEDLAKFADMADAGQLGDTQVWAAAEQRWRDRGLIDEDFVEPADPTTPIDPSIAKVGFPVSLAGGSQRETDARSFTNAVETLRTIRARTTKALVAQELLSQLSYQESLEATPEIIRELHEYVSGVQIEHYSEVRLSSVKSFRTAAPLSAADLAFAEWAGNTFDWIDTSGLHAIAVEQMAATMASNPDAHPGLRTILVNRVEQDGPVRIPESGIPTIASLTRDSPASVVSICLMRQALSPEDVSHIAKVITGGSLNMREIHQALTVAFNVAAERGALLGTDVLRIAELEPVPRGHLLSLAREKLLEYLAQLPSRLIDKQTWMKLALPPQV